MKRLNRGQTIRWTTMFGDTLEGEILGWVTSLWPNGERRRLAVRRTDGTVCWMSPALVREAYGVTEGAE